jgi:hypothetical protein
MCSILTSHPSWSIHSASWRAATSWVRSSATPISIAPGSTIITSPPSSAPAVIIPRIGIPAASRNRITAAYSPRRHHWWSWVTIEPRGVIALESRANTW